MTELALLEAILDDPADDLPRLAYADWCEEQGRTPAEVLRATFIRAQLEIARIEPLACSRTKHLLDGWGKFTPRCRCTACSLKRREYESSKRYIGWEWLGGTGGYAHWCRSANWRRGFLYGVQMPCREFLQYAPSLFADWPIEQVKLDGFAPSREDRCYAIRQSIVGVIIGGSHHDLPPEIFDKLIVGDGVWTNPESGRPDWMEYCFADTTLDNAFADVSQACVEFGREQAAPLRQARRLAA